MRLIIKSLFKRWLSNLLILLQITISLIFFMISYSNYQGTVERYHTVKDILKNNFNTTIMIDVDEDDGDKIMHFSEQLEKNGITRFSGYKNSWLESESFENILYDSLELYNNNSWIKELHVSSGEVFSPKSFSPKYCNGSIQNPYSVLVGCNIAEHYHLNIGDTFCDINQINYKIIGILTNSEIWFVDNITDGNFISLDNQFVVARPISSESILTYYCQTSHGTQPEEAGNIVESLAQKNDIRLSTCYLPEILEQKYKTALSGNFLWISFSIFVLVMITIATASLMSANIYTRLKEIGIKKAVGYSISMILWQFSGETFLIECFAFLIMLCATTFYLTTNHQLINSVIIKQEYLSVKMILYGFLIIVIQWIPSFLVVLYHVKRLQPNELIGASCII